jgi:hypothetical protein
MVKAVMILTVMMMMAVVVINGKEVAFVYFQG